MFWGYFKKKKMTITEDNLVKITGFRTGLMDDLTYWINHFAPMYEVDTPKEFAHFLAQSCHETDHFKTLKEYASGKSYEGRKDLGNTVEGYGVKYKGRGIFQTTGYYNYRALGIKKGDERLFLDNPELLEQPEYAVWSAFEFWDERGFNDIANLPDSKKVTLKVRGKVYNVSPVEYISRRIHGGVNGLSERIKFYNRAKLEFDI